MGIEDLNSAIQEYDPNFKKRVNADKFRAKFIGLDVYRWLYANMSVVYGSVIDETDILHQKPNREKARKLLVHTFLDWYIKWVTAVQMYPVLLWDGKSATQKQVAHKKRAKIKEDIAKKIQVFEDSLNTGDDLKKPDPYAYKKLLKQKNWVAKEEIEEMKTLTRCLGIPYFIAKGEAEKLGSSLCIEGKTASLFTTDTDPLVYGCPSIVVDLRSEGTTINGPLFTITETQANDAYKALGLTQKKFVDYCIMLGTDYGNRIKGYGKAKCLDLIKKHETIEAIQIATGLDISSYDHIYCREEFQYTQSKDLIIEGSMIPWVPNETETKEAMQILRKYDLERYFEKICICNNSIPKEIPVTMIAIPGKPKLMIKNNTQEMKVETVTTALVNMQITQPVKTVLIGFDDSL
jgi:5'-3' exonuclease